MADLKPCPFCGGAAYFERTGTRRQSCIVACSDCGARHESSDEDERSGQSWNCRVPAGVLASNEVQAWQHEDDPARVISASQKAQALRDGGASASSVKPYSVPLTRGVREDAK